MERTFSIRKFRLGIFWSIFQEIPFPRENFRSEKQNYSFHLPHLHAIRNFRIFWVNGKQPRGNNNLTRTWSGRVPWRRRCFGMRCGPANPKALVTLLMNKICGLTKTSITCLSPDPSINTLFQTCLIISFLDQTDVKGFVKGFYWWSYRMMNWNVASCKNISSSTLKHKNRSRTCWIANNLFY